MAAKRKNLFLYLTLACFLGIILIFIFDGYMGLYDSLEMDTGQYRQTIEADQWSRQEKYSYLSSIGVERGGSIDFIYKIKNHRFSQYSDFVEASLWRNDEKITDIMSETLSVKSFDEKELTWSLNTAELVPGDIPAELNYNLFIVINRGEVEREIMIDIYPSPYPIRPVITEPPD
jgi:hypothetical protein